MQPDTDNPDAGRTALARKPDGSLVLTLGRELSLATAGPLWRECRQALDQQRAPAVIVDAARLATCDSAGICLLLDLRRRQADTGGTFDLRQFPDVYRPLLNLFEKMETGQPTRPRPPARFLEEVGRAVFQIGHDIAALITFTGELLVALALAGRHPGRTRWRDALVIMEKAGINALPIVFLLGFLLGLILAFQSAIPLRRFGADIFVANLVALGLFRELGPLITAIILAGRSGSAFAAEIGTMKVNEEINALITMGLDPVRFLVVTRVIAALIVTPLLTVFANLFGLLGALVVTRMMGFPLVTFINQVRSAVTTGDFLQGLFKALVFGLLIAAIGCLRGLQTQRGASAVGDAATRAVVSGIILIVISDGLFAVLFYCLGI